MKDKEIDRIMAAIDARKRELRNVLVAEAVFNENVASTRKKADAVKSKD